MRLLSGFGPLAVAAAVTSQDEKRPMELRELSTAFGVSGVGTPKVRNFH
ncbi:hypothetical protein AB0H34_39415 [Saccharopolyspora shandongensis]